MDAMTVYVWREPGPARVIAIPGLTDQQVRTSVTAWCETIEGQLYQVRGAYRDDDLDGVPLLTELERQPCDTPGPYPVVGEAVRLDEHYRVRPG